MRFGFESLLCLILTVTLGKLFLQLYQGVFNLKNMDNNEGLNLHQLHNTLSREILDGEKVVEEESLKTKKSAVLGHQYPRKEGDYL